MQAKMYMRSTSCYTATSPVHRSDQCIHGVPVLLHRLVCWHAEELKELQQKEKEMKVQPDWEIDAFTKAQIRSGKRNSIVTDLILKLLGLDVSPPLPLLLLTIITRKLSSWGMWSKSELARQTCSEQVSAFDASLLPNLL